MCVQGDITLLKPVRPYDHRSGSSSQHCGLVRIKTFLWKGIIFVFVAKNSTCDSGPCENGGTCVGGGDAFTCICKDGWEGPTCAQSASLLKLLPCSHHM